MKRPLFLWAFLLVAWISTPLGVHAYDFVGTGFGAQDTPATLNPLIEEYDADHAPLQLITKPFEVELFPDSESQSGIIAWEGGLGFGSPQRGEVYRKKTEGGHACLRKAISQKKFHRTSQRANIWDLR